MALIIIDFFITRGKEKKDHEVLVIYFTISLETKYDMEINSVCSFFYSSFLTNVFSTYSIQKEKINIYSCSETMTCKTTTFPIYLTIFESFREY